MGTESGTSHEMIPFGPNAFEVEDEAARNDPETI
jgi:hypothetical protein